MLRNSLPSKVSVLTARAREFKFALGKILVNARDNSSILIPFSRMKALKSSGKLCSAYRSTGEVNGIDVSNSIELFLVGSLLPSLTC